MRFLVQLLAVGSAGFIGAVARWLIALLFGQSFNIRFPIGTLFINISGSFFLGWFMTVAAGRYSGVISPTMRLAIATGFVGAYTTFSTFMYESNRLTEEGAGIEAMVNLVGSLVLGLIAVRLGILLARRV